MKMSKKEMQQSLSNHLKRNGFDVEVEIITDQSDFYEYALSEEQLALMSSDELLSYAGDALRGFVDERRQDAHGLTWQLKVLNEINHREGMRPDDNK
jgi:ABC-type Zn uptake system ZnuABC Zn-binding protein ZnuA